MGTGRGMNFFNQNFWISFYWYILKKKKIFKLQGTMAPHWDFLLITSTNSLEVEDGKCNVKTLFEKNKNIIEKKKKKKDKNQNWTDCKSKPYIRYMWDILEMQSIITKYGPTEKVKD